MFANIYVIIVFVMLPGKSAGRTGGERPGVLGQAGNAAGREDCEENTAADRQRLPDAAVRGVCLSGHVVVVVLL